MIPRLPRFHLHKLDEKVRPYGTRDEYYTINVLILKQCMVCLERYTRTWYVFVYSQSMFT